MNGIAYAGRSLRSSCTGGSLRTDCARRTRFALRSLRSRCTGRPLRTDRSGHALRTAKSVEAARPRYSLRSDGTARSCYHAAKSCGRIARINIVSA